MYDRLLSENTSLVDDFVASANKLIVHIGARIRRVK